MKMHEKKLRKFNIYKKIANVLFVLTIVLGTLLILVALGATIYLLSTGGDITEFVAQVAPEAEGRLHIPEDFVMPYGIAYMMMAYIAIATAFIAYLFKAVSKMFGHIVTDETPFTQSVVRTLKSMGIAFFIYAGIMFIMSIVMANVAIPPVNMRFDINIDGKSLLFGVLLLALGEIFEYGLGLQRDSESIV